MQGGYAIYHMAVIVYGLDFKICSVQAGTLVVRISTGWDWKMKYSHRMRDLAQPTSVAAWPAKTQRAPPRDYTASPRVANFAYASSISLVMPFFTSRMAALNSSMVM